MIKVLIAGVGNILRGDDGFGVRVVQRLANLPRPESVRVVEVGISGFSLVQELMDGYEACIVVDAADRGRAPGTLYLIEPDLAIPSDAQAERLHHELIDAHYADPSRALLLAAALGIKPRRTFVVGCQPAKVEELRETLSPPVERAVPEALHMVRELITRLHQEAEGRV